MSDIQERLGELHSKGWTDASISDEIGYGRVTVFRWRSGERYPAHSKSILMALDALMKRKPPPRRRYPGTHHLQRKGSKSGADSE